ncbi:Predicted transcriptional regulator, BolA superfamily [Kluyvera cryocrescens]|uniref:Predicted transcriptional regulator, BolA superfamily n=1 Tax=Kluyvera cryocrescens TaxID=580 RepID=A0A485AIA7_KLUCR|nr:Predicted transcriptional regulator, BolA superfamily [Kluyvera cryocrescens]
MEYIADNRIHALSIKAYTPQEWARDSQTQRFFEPGGKWNHFPGGEREYLTEIRFDG